MKKFLAGLLVALVSGFVPVISVFADNLHDVIVAPYSDTFTAGSSTVVGYKISATGGDGHTGCNVSVDDPATLEIVTPAGITADPSEFEVTFCTTFNNNLYNVTFTSDTPGDYDITVNASGGLGTYNTISGKTTLHVLAPTPTDVTPPVVVPTVDGTLGDNDWYVSDVEISWDVIDDESAISSSTGCETVLLTTDTTGATYTCEATSEGGTTSESVTVKRDATAPDISLVSTTIEGEDYVQGTWTNLAVSANFLCEDETSGPVELNNIQVLDEEGEDQGVTGTCTDMAGNTTEDSTSVTDVDIDMTAATASASVDPAPNGNGWNNTDVTVSFEGTDALSGVASCSSDVILSIEGEGQSASGTCTDNAGNESEPATVENINIDKTLPDIIITAPVDGASYSLNEVVNADYECTDVLSGPDTCVGDVADGSPIDTDDMGLHEFTVTATDSADNEASTTVEYSVGYQAFTGFKSPLSISLKEFKKTSTIPVKFQLFDFFGNPFEDAVATLKVNGVNAVASGASNVGNLFRYDPVAKQYIFNLSTKSLSVGNNTLQLTLDGNLQSDVIFKIK
jgi:hypothetical protein